MTAALHPESRPTDKLIADTVGRYTALSKMIGNTNFSKMALFRSGKLAPNDPIVEKIAAALKRDVEVVRSLCHGKPLDENQLRRALTGRKRAGMKYRRRGSSSPGPGGALTLHTSGSKPTRNTLKRQVLNLREAVRAVTMTLNMQMMAGSKTIQLPTDAVAVLMQDYFEARKVKGVLVVSPNFAELFG